MIKLDLYANKRVGVVGLGKTGLSVADALRQSGAIVLEYDDRNQCDYSSIDSLDALVVSPGVCLEWPKRHIAVRIAYEHSIPVLTDVDLFMQSVRKKNVCITGTNGKSTTTSLVGHILNGCIHTVIGGNIGYPILSLADDYDCYVFELSSFQLEGSNVLGFDTSVLLNITPDHLTRHGGMQGYITSKQKIFANFHAGSSAIVGIDDNYCTDIYQFLRTIHYPHVIPISGVSVPCGGVGWADNCLIDNTAGSNECVCNNIPSFDGSHNRQNIAAAYAVSICNGVPKYAFCARLHTFQGLAHRQELIATINNVQYINDSKATNADSVEQALKRFDNIIWILGGKPKEDGIGKLAPYFDKIRFAYLIGESAEEWSTLLTAHSVPNVVAKYMKDAVRAAYEKTHMIDANVVLLSPASASFDQYNNFEERGDDFRRLVLNIKDTVNG